MTYRIEAASREEWAERALRAEAKLAAIRAFIDGQTRHNCGLVKTLREMLE